MRDAAYDDADDGDVVLHVVGMGLTSLSSSSSVHVVGP